MRGARSEGGGWSAVAVPVVLALAVAGLVGCTAADAQRTEPPPAAPGTSIVVGQAAPPSSGPAGDSGAGGGPGPEATATTPSATAPPPVAYVATEGFRRLRAVGVPALAARAYLNASQRAPEALPGCRMPPEVLAAVGAGESRHGTIGSFDEDGTSRQRIKGYATVGDDSDAGDLDGDDESDWAVGPMQFTPETWQDLGRDGDGDGDRDPHNFYDAALATAAYLCHLTGPVGDVTTVAAQWDQWDRQKAQAEQRTEELKEEWARDKQEREALEQHVRTYPDDTVTAERLARLPELGPEPEYEEPPMPSGPAQVRNGIERYYGPSGDVRDDYREDVESVFRRLVAGTRGAPVVDGDRLP